MSLAPAKAALPSSNRVAQSDTNYAPVEAAYRVTLGAFAQGRCHARFGGLIHSSIVRSFAQSGARTRQVTRAGTPCFLEDGRRDGLELVRARFEHWTCSIQYVRTVTAYTGDTGEVSWGRSR